MKRFFYLLLYILCALTAHAEDGYRLWLRYDKIDNPVLLQQYRNQINSIFFENSSPVLSVAKKELLTDLQALLGKKINESDKINNNSILIFIFSKHLIPCCGQNTSPF